MASEATRSTTLIIVGAAGKLGARIAALSRTRFDHAAIFGVVRSSRAGVAMPDSPALITMDQLGVPPGAPVVIIDASSDEGALASAALASRLLKDSHRVALLVCTTALSSATIESIRSVSRQAPVLVTPNTSLGVAAVATAAGLLARALGPDYRASIIEAHHQHKKDAPSGTARRLAGALRDAGTPVPDEAIFAIRAGDVIGEHTIRLTGPGEVIELAHRATTRDLFARGAVELAAWLASAEPGWRTMDDFIARRGA